MKKERWTMKKSKKHLNLYNLDTNRYGLCILANVLIYCLFKSKDFRCCESCRVAGMELLEKIVTLLENNFKHN